MGYFLFAHGSPTDEKSHDDAGQPTSTSGGGHRTDVGLAPGGHSPEEDGGLTASAQGRVAEVLGLIAADLDPNRPGPSDPVLRAQALMGRATGGVAQFVEAMLSTCTGKREPEWKRLVQVTLTGVGSVGAESEELRAVLAALHSGLAGRDWSGEEGEWCALAALDVLCLLARFGSATADVMWAVDQLQPAISVRLGRSPTSVSFLERLCRLPVDETALGSQLREALRQAASGVLEEGDLILLLRPEVLERVRKVADGFQEAELDALLDSGRPRIARVAMALDAARARSLSVALERLDRVQQSRVLRGELLVESLRDLLDGYGEDMLRQLGPVLSAARDTTYTDLLRLLGPTLRATIPEAKARAVLSQLANDRRLKWNSRTRMLERL